MNFSTLHLRQRAAEICGPFDLRNPRADLDYLYWWKRGAELVGPEAFVATCSVPSTANCLSDLPLAELPVVLKRLQTLDTPRRCLLLTMASLAQPHLALWLQREHQLTFGHLTASALGGEVFQVIAGLLANHRSTFNH